MCRACVKGRLRVAVSVLLIIIVVSVSVWGGTVNLTLQGSPDEVERGGLLTYTAVITNSGGSSVSLTYQNSLPTGLDQWSAQYRLNGGGWLAYPATGLIPLGAVAGGSSVSVEIEASVEYSAPGTMTDTARVTDGTTQLASATTTTNVLPSVDAGADKMVGLGGAVSLSDASAGDGGDGIAAYAWDDDGKGGHFDDENAPHPTYTAPGTSELVRITLTVTDHQGGEASDSFWLRVNAFPTADAGSDKTVNEGDAIALTDAFANDSDGWIAAYSWSDNGGGGSFDDPGALHPTYTAPMTDNCSGEDITLSLTVTDDWGAQSSDSLIVRVNNVNSPPVVDAGLDQTVWEGEEVTLTGSASDTDGTIASYHWEQTGGPAVSLAGANTSQAAFTAPAVSSLTTLQFRLTVTDDCGTGASDTISVQVKHINVLPTVDAGPDQTVHASDSVVLTGSASDPDGTIVSYTWEQTGGPGVSLAGANTSHATFTAPAVSSPISLRFRFTATDNDGGSASDEVMVTVNPGLSPPEEASISVEKYADRESAGLGEMITYTYTVTNTGGVALFNVTATDDKLGDISLSKTSLAPGESATGTASARATKTDFPGPLTNTVTVRGMSGEGTVVTASDEARVELTTARSSIEVVLEAQDSRGFPISPLDTLSVGDTIIFVYTITNTGATTLTDLSLVDDPLGMIPLSRNTLAPWERLSGSFSVTIREADLPGPLTNTVIVTAIDPSGRTVTDRDTLVLFDLSSEDALTLWKTSDITEATIGDVITYTYTITNTGDVMITDLVLVDDHVGEIPLPTRVLSPGESLTVTATYTVTEADLPGPLTNSASVSGLGPLGGQTATETTVSVALNGAAGGGGAVSGRLDGRVIINEVAWAGTPADPGDEWIELRNLGTIPVDLSGWTLCWYPKGEAVPDESLWARVELSGTISPSPIDLSLPRKTESKIIFTKGREDDLSWRVFDMNWWVAGKEGEEGRGYYILERQLDETVRNVQADLIYDVQTLPLLDLPDEGAAILLFDSEGNLVDTANAEHPEASGWPGGDARTRATMERSDPLLGDIDSNWHTNPGILIYGLDTDGHRMAATAGKPNSPDLEDLTFLAQAEVGASPVGERVEVPLTKMGYDPHPWVRVTVLGLAAAGGGGALPSDFSFATHSTKGGESLAIDTVTLPAGTYYIWVTGKEGEAILVPISITP